MAPSTFPPLASAFCSATGTAYETDGPLGLSTLTASAMAQLRGCRQANRRGAVSRRTAAQRSAIGQPRRLTFRFSYFSSFPPFFFRLFSPRSEVARSRPAYSSTTGLKYKTLCDNEVMALRGTGCEYK